MAFHLGVQKDKKIWLFIIVFVALATAATLLAIQSGFLPATPEPGYDFSDATCEEGGAC